MTVSDRLSSLEVRLDFDTATSCGVHTEGNQQPTRERAAATPCDHVTLHARPEASAAAARWSLAQP